MYLEGMPQTIDGFTVHQVFDGCCKYPKLVQTKAAATEALLKEILDIGRHLLFEPSEIGCGVTVATCCVKHFDEPSMALHKEPVQSITHCGMAQVTLFIFR